MPLRSVRWLAAWLAVALSLLAAGRAAAAVERVGDIQMTVADLDREVAFFTRVLGFHELERIERAGAALENLTALPGARSQEARLQLGDETVRLTAFVTPRGRPIPADSRSHDHWFQHIAIVVGDMDRAYAYLRQQRVRHVSTAPQTLPAWNPNAGGIRAFYFRDPEDHVLEVIAFPPGKGDPRWQRLASERPDRIFLGIDHTAIVVADTERSLAFYRDRLGLRVAGESENHGVEQEHLNQVFGARLRITALRAPAGPGIEFLEYLTPPGGRPLPADARVNDLLAWVVDLHGDLPELPNRVSRRAAARGRASATLHRDPDGHLLQLWPGRSSDRSGS